MAQSALRNIATTFQSNEAFLILCVQVAVLHVGQSLIEPILPLYARTFAVSTTLVGFLLTSQALPRLFVNLPAGRLADRWGANRLMMGAAGIVTLSAIAGAVAPTYWLFLLTRLLQGIGTGASQVAGFTYTATISPRESRARYISLYQGSFLLGNSVGPMIGGFTAQYLGFRAPFLVYAALAACAGAWMFLRLPDPRDLETASGRHHPAETRFFTSTARMLRHRGVLLGSSIGLLAAFTRAASRGMAVPLRGSDLGLEPGQIGLAMSTIFASTFLALYLAGALADRYGSKAVIVPSWLLTGLALGLVAIAPHYAFYLLGAVLYGLAAGVGSPVPAAYVTHAAEGEGQGTAIGLFRTLGELGAVAGPLVMGWIADRAGIASGLYVNGAVVVVAALAFQVAAPETRPERETTRISA